jgi:long-chain fatty acid transport protein
MGNFELNRALNYSGGASASLSGASDGLGFNVGLFFKAGDRVNVGISYRSEVIIKVDDGDAKFNVPSSIETLVPPENKFESELPLPSNLDFGIAVKASDKVTLAFEFNWINWSIYDSLKFTFQESGDLLNSANPRRYRDSFIPRVGVEWAINDMFVFRGGFYYDQSPTNEKYFSPETVSLNQVAYTLGLSVMPVEGLSIDVSWLNLFGLQDERTYLPDNFGGTYTSITYIPGLGISYTF